MAKSAKERQRDYRARKKDAPVVVRVAKVEPVTVADDNPADTYMLPQDTNAATTARRVLLQEALCPTPPMEGGAIRVAAARAILADNDRRIERAMKERAAKKDEQPFDFGLDDEQDKGDDARKGGHA